jgi:hypothetical protein
MDRIPMGKSREDIFPRAMVYKLPREVSDYKHLILTNLGSQTLKKLTFCFELSWLKHPDFIPLTKKIWMTPFMLFLHFLRLSKS